MAQNKCKVRIYDRVWKMPKDEWSLTCINLEQQNRRKPTWSHEEFLYRTGRLMPVAACVRVESSLRVLQ